MRQLFQDFVDKVSNIASSIHSKLAGRSLDQFKYNHSHNRALLDTDEVRKILPEMPAKSSPMDF